MNFEFEHLGSPTPFTLPEGLHRLGGGDADEVRLEGLAPGLLTLSIEGSRLTVECTQVFTVAGVLVPPGVPRLIHPDEVVGLAEGMSLKVQGFETGPAREMGTVAMLKHLLTGSEAPPSRAASLLCLTGEDGGRTFALAETSTALGRGGDVQVRLRDRSVSRHHARILHQEGTFLLEDLGSPNGIYLNGQRLEAPASLREGDVLEMGRTLLRFQAPLLEAPAPAEEVPEPPPGPLPEQEPPGRSRGRVEGGLLWLGGLLALVGLLAAFALTP